MSSIAARRANKRACQWQPNGMLSRGTHAYPGANGGEDAESLHPTRGNAADQVGFACHNYGHIARPGRRPPPAPCTSFLGAWARGFAAQRWPRNAFAGAISGRGVSAFCASATSFSKYLRARGPFIEVNCAAILESLLEAELFRLRGGGLHGCQACQAWPV